VRPITALAPKHPVARRTAAQRKCERGDLSKDDLEALLEELHSFRTYH
jgi:hypothetical protein